MLREIALARGAPPAHHRRTPLAQQYADFATQQRGRAGRRGDARVADYWRRALDSVATLDPDRLAAPGADHAGACSRFTVDAELTRAIKALARLERCRS
jgi:hypothetical protein